MTRTEVTFQTTYPNGQYGLMYIKISNEFPLWECYSETTKRNIIDNYIKRYAEEGIRLELITVEDY